MPKDLKKNAQQDLSVEQKLQSLYKYQTVLSKIDEIRTVRGELPLEVQDLEDEIEGLATRISNLQEELKAINSDITHWNEDKRKAQDAIQRCQAHLDDVRNNREYDAFNKEIEFQQLEIQLRDKKLREAAEHKVAVENDIDHYRELREERQADLEAKKSELEDIVSETRVEEDNLRDEAKILEASLDYRLLTSFKRIRKNSHNGLGIVCVQRDACGGCFNKIPPQRQLDVRMHKKIIVCEYCGRILIDPQLAGLEPVEPAAEEAKPKRRTNTRRKASTAAK